MSQKQALQFPHHHQQGRQRRCLLLLDSSFDSFCCLILGTALDDPSGYLLDLLQLAAVRGGDLQEGEEPGDSGTLLSVEIS